MTPEAAAAYRELLVKDQQGHTSRASSISKTVQLSCTSMDQRKECSATHSSGELHTVTVCVHCIYKQCVCVL